MQTLFICDISQVLFSILKKVLRTFLLPLGKHTSNIVFSVNTAKFMFKENKNKTERDKNFALRNYQLVFIPKST